MRVRTIAFIVAMTFPAAALGHASQQDRAALEGEIKALVVELKETENLFLAPSAEDQAKYSQFLTQPDTGLIRLLPRGVYDSKLTIRGGGSYYSFVRLTHEYGYGSDIELQQGQFMVGFAGADFGFITRLGKIPIESATIDHPGAAYLSEYAPPTTIAQATDEFRRADAGFEVNGFTYKSRQRLKAKSTYLLRSINYRTSDVLVAFRVAGQDSDGSVDIVWRILKRFPVPQLGT